MAKVKCPDCGKYVSQYAEACPECGFPIERKFNEHNLTDKTKIWICTKCGNDASSAGTMFCKYCGNPIIQTKYDIKEHNKKMYKINEGLPIPEKDKNSNQENIRIAKEYGDNFDEEENKKFLQRRSAELDAYFGNKNKTNSNYSSTSTPKLHCPTCGSANVKKISLASKAVGAGLFGLFSKTARSQFECNSCGYKW